MMSGVTGRSGRRRAAVALVAALLATAAVLVGSPNAQGGTVEASRARALQAGPDDRPNVVLVLTDDMTDSDLRFMPRTRKLLGKPGVSFPNMLSPHPLCCPARAAILTGQYAQNNHVKANQGKYAFAALDPKHTLPVWLSRAGYRTGFTGKYLNGFGTRGRSQPGWTWWDPSIGGQYAYEGFRMYRDGASEYYSDLNNVDYVNRETERLIREWAPDPQPFFLFASHVAPHGRVDPTTGKASAIALPPKRFRTMFRHTNPPSMRDKGFNENVQDKTRWVRRKHGKKIPVSHVKHVFRSRIQSLQGVDQGVAGIVKELRATGELDNTLIIFTSDNGFLLGEHRLLTKNVPYQQSLGVPLLMRGPGVPRGVTRHQFALMIDLAPTIADVARARPDLKVDGTSLMPSIRENRPLRETVLIQAGPQEPPDRKYGWWWRGVTTARYTYAYYFAEHFEELYDRKYDPTENTNVAGHPFYRRTVAELRKRTAALRTCAGTASCSRRWGPVPGPLLPPGF
jgi:N-acetylglucosamine-6-sulfatase